MEEDAKRHWDVRIAAGAQILTAALLCVNLVQFYSSQHERQRLSEAEGRNTLALEDKKDELQFRRQLWLEQVGAYRTVAAVAGRIAATPLGAERDKAIIDFESAYWGAMSMADDGRVKQAMIEFHVELNSAKRGIQSDPDRLKVRAELLAIACNKSLHEGSANGYNPGNASKTDGRRPG